MDRMNLWIQSVEKVVEETHQNFTSTSIAEPTALPLVPVSHSSSQNNCLCQSQHNISNMTCSSHLPCRHLPANQIFAEMTDPNAPLSPAHEDWSMSFSYIDAPESSCPILPTLERNKYREDVLDVGTPSKRREKSRTVEKPVTPHLSTVLDRSLFIAMPISPRPVENLNNDLMASPYHVEPYPPYGSSELQNVPPSPERCHLEGVYDQFLMATTGVKHVGRGYQSDNFRLLQNTIPLDASKLPMSHCCTFSVFSTSRCQMPPPMSSDDISCQPSSINELGFATCTTPWVFKDDSKNTAALTVSRRLSHTLVT
ncbi:hypothetical protein EDC04DRAFT_2778224 [Pisolithus marmoratus]|nr:hypothetical protein EDC04DRAFT_2778224 [Pisolithus marmoratus]